MQMCEKALSHFPAHAHSGLKNFHSLRKNIFFSTSIFIFKIVTNDLIKSLWSLSNAIWSIYFTFCVVICRDSAFLFYGLYLTLSHETYLIIWCDINQAWMISEFLLKSCYCKRSDSNTTAKMSSCQAIEKYHLYFHK